MTIIKYQNKEDYCLVQKTTVFTYFLLFKNKKFYYYENFLNSNFDKTYKICSRLLGEKEIKIKEIKINSFDVLNKMNNFVAKKEAEYSIISDTFCDDDLVSFQVYKNNEKIDSLIGVKNSGSFLVSYIDYKIYTLFPKNIEFLVNFKDSKFNTENAKSLISILDKKEINLYKRYFKYLFHLYKKLEFDDLYINFNILFKIKNIKKILLSSYIYYDQIIGEYFEKIIKNILIKKPTIKENLNYFISYFKYYFPFLNFLYYLEKNNIKNKKVVLCSCLFSIRYTESYLDDKNKYIINPYSVMKEKMLLFIDENITEKEIENILLIKKPIEIRKIFKSIL